MTPGSALRPVDGLEICVLFDAGPEGDTLRANARKLGLDFGELDAVAPSHGHWDHAGGLASALGLVGRPVPMHVNPDMFESRGFKLPSGTVLPMGDVPSPAALARARGEVVNDAAARTIVDDRFFLSGAIPRVTHAAELFDPIPIHAGVGGLHLSGAANERWIDSTIDDLTRFRLGRIVPTHCTGYRAVHRLIERFRETVIPSAVGQVHRI